MDACTGRRLFTNRSNQPVQGNKQAPKPPENFKKTLLVDIPLTPIYPTVRNFRLFQTKQS
jgi:hypothetical protein